MPNLTRQDIADALDINSPPLVKEIYDIAQRQMQNEAVRQTILDGKASALLATVGLATTLVFTFGCQILLGDAARAMLKDLDWSHKVALGVCFAVGVLGSLSASAHAIWAVKVTGDYRTVNERTVFNKDVIKSALEAADDYAVTTYRRYLTPQLWEIAQNDAAVHDRKAKLVVRGQVSFLLFVIAVAAIATLVIRLVFDKHL